MKQFKVETLLLAAATATAGGIILLPIFTALWGYPAGMRLVFALLIAAYACCLLSRAGLRAGWAVFGLTSALFLISSYFFPLFWTAVCGCAALWMIRCLLSRRSLSGFLADAGFSVVACWMFFSALPASFALAVWAFFLLHAGTAFIKPRQAAKTRNDPVVEQDRFAAAHKAAEAALQSLSLR